MKKSKSKKRRGKKKSSVKNDCKRRRVRRNKDGSYNKEDLEHNRKCYEKNMMKDNPWMKDVLKEKNPSPYDKYLKKLIKKRCKSKKKSKSKRKYRINDCPELIQLETAPDTFEEWESWIINAINKCGGEQRVCEKLREIADNDDIEVADIIPDFLICN